jgi:hypothetical protein
VHHPDLTGDGRPTTDPSVTASRPGPEGFQEVLELLQESAGKILWCSSLTAGLMSRLPASAAVRVGAEVDELDALARSLRGVITRLARAAEAGRSDQGDGTPF